MLCSDVSLGEMSAAALSEINKPTGAIRAFMSKTGINESDLSFKMINSQCCFMKWFSNIFPLLSGIKKTQQMKQSEEEKWILS